MYISEYDKNRHEKPHKSAQGVSRARERSVTSRTESEKAVEAYLVRRVRELGGVCLKFASSTTTGYPDRIVLLPDGVSFWVELKTTGCKPEPKQLARHRELRHLGQTVYVIDSREGVDSVL